MSKNTENKKTTSSFGKIAKDLSKLEDNILAEGELIKGKTELFDTDKEARTDARLNALMEGKTFDESETPPEELKTIEDDIIHRIVEKRLNLILGD